ncbi:hypothetical protein MHU86_10318 [Fragilaria crotonensis]|nr:hypothetical protein MHU86_10318 [Fragilaria crotonensis]
MFLSSSLRRIIPPTAARAATYTPSQIFRFSMSSSDRKPGMASPSELREFIAAAGDKLVIVDVRNPNFDVEPGDARSVALAPLPNPETRPRAQLLTFDRNTSTIPLPDADKGAYIITHCAAGFRGSDAKKYLEQHGFKNVINGGGPTEKELWELYGDK